jgi:AcrR family transcriptional regulator
VARALFTRDDFVESAAALIAEGGPGAATTNAVIQGCRATVGSFYHRFASRDELLGELWLGLAEGYQRDFLTLLREGDISAAALFTPRWVRLHPREARILLQHKREDFMEDKWPPAFKRRARRLAAELREGLRECAERQFGCCSEEALYQVCFALIDVPLAAVRRSLSAGTPVPLQADLLVLKCCRALIPKRANRKGNLKNE